MNGLAWGLIFCATVIGSIALVLSCIAVSVVIGLKNSTHSVQYVTPSEMQPLKKLAEEFNKIEEEVEENLL